jgi:hypothetical protein
MPTATPMPTATETVKSAGNFQLHLPLITR